MSHRWGRKSKSLLNTCHSDIRLVFNEVLRRSCIDISIVYGKRTTQQQKNLYAKGRTAPGVIITNADGVKKKSKHQEIIKGEGSHAIDISIYCGEGKYGSALRYDPLHLAYIAGVVDAVSKEMLEAGEINHELVWGGNWDKDGVIKFDQSFLDLCHWELKEIDNNK